MLVIYVRNGRILFQSYKGKVQGSYTKEEKKDQGMVV
jgi:hypothetical protein